MVLYSVGHFCSCYSLSVVLGFCQGLGPSQPKIQEPMAKRRLDSKEQEHLLHFHCEFAFK